jgi:hypothetical protein
LTIVFWCCRSQQRSGNRWQHCTMAQIIKFFDDFQTMLEKNGGRWYRYLHIFTLHLQRFTTERVY